MTVRTLLWVNLAGEWSRKGRVVVAPAPVPVVSGLSPVSGVVGSTVTISGQGLAGVTGVRFGVGASAGVVAQFTVVSATQVSAVVPSGAVTGQVQVSAPGGVAVSSVAFTVTAPPVDPPTPPTNPHPGFTQVLDEQFAGIDPTKWSVYDNSTFGAPMRIQRYMARNVTVGPGSSGSTGSTSVKLQVKRETVGTNSFTAGMMDTKTAGYWLPRFGFFEFRCKIPHGQGIWPSIWLTAKSGGATMCEFDIMEYFHAQVPGKNHVTLHGTDNTGTFHANRYTNNVGGRMFFEAPTYNPAWHVWATEIVPVTDAGGTVLADPTKPSSFVRFTVYLDGVQKYRFVDTSALTWTTNGGTADSFWNVYVQGSQVSGDYVGHPDDPLGYSRTLNACISGGGTAPDACTKVVGGYPIQRAGAGLQAASLASFSDPSTTLEVDYFTAYKFTG